MHYQMDESEGQAETINHRELAVSSAGNITATFRVPGTITVPSDGASHNVTVARLELDATMSWVSVPKQDAKTHLKVCSSNSLVSSLRLMFCIGQDQERL